MKIVTRDKSLPTFGELSYGETFRLANDSKWASARRIVIKTGDDKGVALDDGSVTGMNSGVPVTRVSGQFVEEP